MNSQQIVLDSAPTYWYDGFPIGTGRLAAMVLSHPGSDLLTLNHEALWTNLGVNKTCSDFTEFLPEFRRLIAEHKNNEATEFLEAHSQTLNRIPGHGVNPFVPAGEILFQYDFPENAKENAVQRTLDLPLGQAEIQFAGSNRTFWGNPQKDCLEGTVSFRNPVSADLTLTRNAVNETWGDSKPEYAFQDGLLKMTGSVPGGVHYCIVCRIAGEFNAEPSALGNGLHFTNLKKLVFRCNVGCGNSLEDAEKEAALPAFEAASFESDRKKRDAGYRKVWDDLASVEVPSSEEVIRYFNFAKHLLLNGTTTGSYPLNLQGKWNADPVPLWDSDYHLDINLQMNYWPAPAFGLECANRAFLLFLERMLPGAREAAKKMFGCRGIWWPLTSDPFFRPNGSGKWGISSATIPWLSAHFFQHFRYTQDLEFLRNHAFPFLREAILFLEDFITYRPDGTACLSPSTSPENSYAGADKYPVTICENSSMDLEIAGELLANGIAASEILGEDPEERMRWQKVKNALPPLKIGNDGRLLEWEQEVKEMDPGHRHISHLYGIWPGKTITQEKTPELFEAARKSLAYRLQFGSGYTGWSRAWCANFKAIFGDGNGALQELKTQVEKLSSVSLMDLHPAPREGNHVFQIDGNLGAASAVFNMLLQDSADNGIRLLPALPDEWNEGNASGIRAPGGLVFDFSWKNGKIISLTIHAKTERKLHLAYNGLTHEITLAAGRNEIDVK